jgi:hypothetical protein
MATTIPHMQMSNEARIAFAKQKTEREQYDRSNAINSNGGVLTKYNIEFKNYYTTANVSSNCNSITFVNLGINTVQINGYPLTQGQQLSIQGNINEIDNTSYQLQFSIAQSVDNNVAVIRKLY